MTAKEIFEIEPIQKNSIFVIIFVCFVSFLQLYLFKTNFINESDFVKITLSVAVSICWIIAEIPTYIFAVPTLTPQKGDIIKNRFIEFLIVSVGFSLLFWMVMVTYISYEFNLSIKNFIRLSVISMFLKGLYWFNRNRVYKSKLKSMQ